MKYIILIVLIISSTIPATSHAFGLLQYTWEGVANQLGLDRGPIPKLAPRMVLDPYTSPLDAQKRVVCYPEPQLQAEGF